MTGVNGIVDKLMSQLDSTIEADYCEWLNILLKTESIHSFSDLAEVPAHFIKLTEILGLDPTKSDHNYAYKRDIKNYAAYLGSLWKNKFDFDIFGVFDPYFQKIFSSSFQFRTKFFDVIYSHTRLIVFVILIVTLLTYPNETDHENPVFEQSIENLPKSVSDKLKPHLYVVLVDLAEAVNEEAKKAEASQEKKPFADKQVFARVEAQQVQIQLLETERDELKTKVTEMEQKLKDHGQSLDEKKNQVQQLTFTCEDLKEKLKNRNAEIISEEIRERDGEIKRLREDLQDLEKKRLIEAQQWRDDKEFLQKRIQMLDNLRADFESKVEESANRVNEEEAFKLREKIANLQRQNLDEKERCLNLEVERDKLRLEITSLKNEKQDLEFKVRELGGDANNTSDIYFEDYEKIAQDLNPEPELHELNEEKVNPKQFLSEDSKKGEEHANEPLMSPKESLKPHPFAFEGKDSGQEKASTIVKNYQKKCLLHVKRLCEQLKERKEKLDEVLKDQEQLRDQNEELAEKCTQIENRVVGDFIDNNAEVKKLFEYIKTHSDSSEVAQTMLQKILKMEHEIQRQAANRRRIINEGLDIQLRALEHVQLIFSVVSGFVKN